MGIAKRMWMEAQECDWEETETSFECPKCGKESDGSIDIPNISEKYTDDFTINIDLSCIWCAENFTAKFSVNYGEPEINLDGYPKIKVYFEPVYYDTGPSWENDPDFLEYPEYPFQVFELACNEVMALSEKFGETHASSSMNRIVNRHLKLTHLIC